MTSVSPRCSRWKLPRRTRGEKSSVCATGLSWRRSNTSSLDWVKGLAVITGKGGRTRTVFFSESAMLALNAYLDARKDNLPPLFIHHDRAHRAAAPAGRTAAESEGMRLTRQGVERVVRRYAQIAGVEATPHSFRHYGATELLKNGADIRTVQELLGHASVATTQIYTHVNPQRLHQEWRRFHPANEDDATTAAPVETQVRRGA
ncbi:MAG: tyrosine-type recombinase/integrase [Chloroflexi bacterium]|nr:tyrosine-type recombinase/integrase [Chloroflexota bacterium]